MSAGRKIPKPRKQTLARNGRVSLLKLTDPETGSYVFAVKYPHKVGNEESSLFITSQFLKYPEAALEFTKMAKFFAGRSSVQMVRAALGN